jgi:hypothetical protein
MYPTAETPFYELVIAKKNGTVRIHEVGDDYISLEGLSLVEFVTPHFRVIPLNIVIFSHLQE